jgi:hypothetical protein
LSSKYIKENIDVLQRAHSQNIKSDYEYKVHMTYNTRFKILRHGLNENKRGRPTVNIDFEEQSDLFKGCKPDPYKWCQLQQKWKMLRSA